MTPSTQLGEGVKPFVKPVLYLKPYQDKICTVSNIIDLFKSEYYKTWKVEFVVTPESKSFLYTLVYYFLGEKNFYLSPNIFAYNKNAPCLSKGLLIIGNPGVGKTSILIVLQTIFTKFVEYHTSSYFSIYKVIDLITEFEGLLTPAERSAFYDKYGAGFRCLDDVKSERDASNFGKSNVLKDLLFLRENKGSRTIITCNYDVTYPNDPLEAIEEFRIRYDDRIYDRLFSMFNFIEIKGPSFRK